MLKAEKMWQLLSPRKSKQHQCIGVEAVKERFKWDFHGMKGCLQIMKCPLWPVAKVKRDTKACAHCFPYTQRESTTTVNKHTPLSSGYWLLHTNPSQIRLESIETGAITQPCVCVRLRVCLYWIKRKSDHAECKSWTWVLTIPEVVSVCWSSVSQTPGKQEQ